MLDTLRRLAPCSVYALAKAAGRSYSNAHADSVRLDELGLVERDDEGGIAVPYESLDMLFPLVHLV